MEKMRRKSEGAWLGESRRGGGKGGHSSAHRRLGSCALVRILGDTARNILLVPLPLCVRKIVSWRVQERGRGKGGAALEFK